MDPKPIQNLDDARLMPRYRGSGTLLEQHRMRRLQASALAAGTDGNPADGRQRSVKAEPGELRGIPVQARGVGGVSPGSSPESAIASIDRERDRRARAAAGPDEPMVAFA